MRRILLVSVIFAAMLLSACGVFTTPTPTPTSTPRPTSTPTSPMGTATTTPPTPSSVANAEPSGTYAATYMGIEQTITFKGDVLEIYNRLDGKHVFKYTISKDGSKLTTTDVATNVSKTYSFKYIKEYECVLSNVGLGVDLTPIQYYKK